MIVTTIDAHIGYAMSFVKRRIRYESFRRNVDDIRQSAAVAAIQTIRSGGEIKESALQVWSEYRGDRGENRRYITREHWDTVHCQRCEGHEPIPDRYFAKCSDRERTALCLAYECDLSRNDIAEMLNVSVKAANLLLVRGRKKVAAVA